MSNEKPRSARCVFLDRDGTIIEDVTYLSTSDGVKILDGAVEGMKLLREHGFLLVVVTNQSGIARGYFTEDDLSEIHKRMRSLLRERQVDYDDLYYCPHLAEGVVEPYYIECDCRKPKPGMLKRAEKRHNIDLSRSFFVGDMEADIEAGRAVGCRTVLIEGPNTIDTDLEEKADHCAENLLEAAKWIVREDAGKR